MEEMLDGWKKMYNWQFRKLKKQQLFLLHKLQLLYRDDYSLFNNGVWYVQKTFPSFSSASSFLISLDKNQKNFFFFLCAKKLSAKNYFFSFSIIFFKYFLSFFLIKPREHTRIKLWTISDQLNRNNWTWNGNDEMRKCLNIVWKIFLSQ